MENNTITANSSYWIKYPRFLPILFAILFCILLDKRYKVSPFLKITGFITAVFTILATNFFPWATLSRLSVPFLDLLQFPFRFVIFGIVLLLIGFALILSSESKIRLAKPVFLMLLLGLSLMQVTYENTTKMIDWHNSETAVNRRVHSYIFIDDEKKMKNQLFSNDKKKILESFQKSAPDYLPLYKKDRSSKYNEYGNDVINKNRYFEKKVLNNEIHVFWKGSKNEKIKVPIIKYERTQLELNGRKLEKGDFSLSTIGVVSVDQRLGENELVVSYHVPWFFMLTLIFPIFAWIIIIISYLKKSINTLLN